MGYYRAGFAVVGVDIVPQPHYPFKFHQWDALMTTFVGFDAVHASPPCQAYMTGGTHRGDHPALIGPVRELLEASRLPWVIENVPGAPLRRDVLLCGSMFSLPLRRHRIFETSFGARMPPRPCAHRGPIVGVYGNPHGKRGAWPGMLPSTKENWEKAMGIDWMTTRELAQAIPPAYTEFIGRQLMGVLRDRDDG